MKANICNSKKLVHAEYQACVPLLLSTRGVEHCDELNELQGKIDKDFQNEHQNRKDSPMILKNLLMLRLSSFKHKIGLCTYIYQVNVWGKNFILTHLNSSSFDLYVT